ncbi:MAG: hypothetical protein IJV50_00525 [Lachnospiraceae bacterium]|nr:hypothetical protein [Lachnospiraceae bacterium]
MKKIYFVITLLIYFGLYAISKIWLRDAYVLEWTARHVYLCTWLVALILIFFDWLRVSFAITLGNLVGIGIGQIIGDWMQSYSMQKITADMSAEMIYRLQLHYGVVLWLFTILVSTITGIVIQLRKHKTVRTK